jgi:hypothetical protein
LQARRAGGAWQVLFLGAWPQAREGAALLGAAN